MNIKEMTELRDILSNIVAELNIKIAQEKGERIEEKANLEEKASGLSIDHKGRTYEKFIPCKYKCGWLSSWANDWKKGDKKLHYNPVTGDIKENCPKYE